MQRRNIFETEITPTKKSKKIVWGRYARKRTFLTFRRAVAKFRRICHVHRRRKIIDIDIEISPLKEVFFAFEVRNVIKES